jgi:hypothetical protein
MTSTRIAAFIVCASFAIGTDAFAQVRAGLNEINFTAALTGTKIEDGDTTTGFTFTGTYGRFLTDHFEVGPELEFFKSEGFDAFGSINGLAAYHFAPNSNVVPFAGGQMGTSFGQDTAFSDNPWQFGFFGGIKAFIGEGGGAVTIQPFWTRHLIHNSIADTTTHIDSFGATAGISIFF